jgi:hypothetical protein
MFSRARLKWGLLGCLVILAVAVVLEPLALSLWKEALFLVGTGSAASAVAIWLMLIATV